jgi:hypothetical protein
MIFDSGTRLKIDRLGITSTYHSNQKASRTAYKSGASVSEHPNRAGPRMRAW